jgi:hypothetical protein
MFLDKHQPVAREDIGLLVSQDDIGRMVISVVIYGLVD